jgi:hypothetical protein
MNWDSPSPNLKRLHILGTRPRVPNQNIACTPDSRVPREIDLQKAREDIDDNGVAAVGIFGRPMDEDGLRVVELARDGLFLGLGDGEGVLGGEQDNGEGLPVWRVVVKTSRVR